MRGADTVSRPGGDEFVVLLPDVQQPEDAAVMANLSVVHEKLVKEGKLGPSLRLLPTTAATTLRGPGLVIDGPFAETKEQLLGFYVIDVENLDAAPVGAVAPLDILRGRLDKALAGDGVAAEQVIADLVRDVEGGILGSAVTASLLRSMLFGVSPWDQGTMLAVVCVLAAATLLASYLPARRAASVNPTEALRAE